MPLLPIGTYEATFTLSGFQGAAGDLDHLGHAAGGELGVDLVQTTTAVQNLIDSRQAQELPINNRNFAKLVELALGVSSSSRSSPRATPPNGRAPGRHRQRRHQVRLRPRTRRATSRAIVSGK